jgi:hypothetical protein
MLNPILWIWTQRCWDLQMGHAKSSHFPSWIPCLLNVVAPRLYLLPPTGNREVFYWGLKVILAISRHEGRGHSKNVTL